MNPLLLDGATRDRLWTAVASEIETYLRGVDSARVTPPLDPAAIRGLLAQFDFDAPRDPLEMVDFIARGLSQYQTHTPHPQYFGLFNPATGAMGVAADALAAAFNPQLAAWSHSPLAIEMEQHLVRAIGARFGLDPASTDGTFCSGGMEANHTAVLTALAAAFPTFTTGGLRALPAQPVLYASAECHHSFHKAAKMCGLGRDALRLVPVDGKLRMIPDALETAIFADRAAGHAPFLVAATAGTTNAGALDPLPEIAAIAAREGLWFHTDAAWGGAAALSPALRPLLGGIERSDSITFDAHKWLSVPMGAGLYLTRHPDALHRAFRTETAYMPKEAAALDVIDPHLHTMQWSRRFTGLKVFLTLAVAGWDGYAAIIDHMTAMGALLRSELASNGWTVLNETELPVVCFNDASGLDPMPIAARLVASGEAWVSTTVLGGGTRALRACITNYRTQASDVHALVAALDRYRM